MCVWMSRLKGYKFDVVHVFEFFFIENWGGKFSNWAEIEFYVHVTGFFGLKISISFSLFYVDLQCSIQLKYIVIYELLLDDEKLCK